MTIRGDEVTLNALRREHKRLAGIAKRAKTKADEYLTIGSESIAIHKAFIEIANSKEHGQAVLGKLNTLNVRRERVNRIMKQDFMKLADREHETELACVAVAEEIGMLEFRASLRRGK